MNKYQVLLRKFKVYSYIGVHPEEKITGTAFEVDLTVQYLTEKTITELEQTVDYVKLSEWVRFEMTKSYDLLETAADAIAIRIEQGYPFISEINITITKLCPPVPNFQGELGVSLTKIVT